MEIYADGACNSKTGDCAWASVVDHQGRDLLSPEDQNLKDLMIEKKNLPKGDRNVIICKANDVASQQNNYAELLAMVAALRIAKERGSENERGSETKNESGGEKNEKIKKINSDSQLIVNYWSQGKFNIKTWNKMDVQKQKFIVECAKLRKEFEATGGKIIKISGDDNLADLGYHK